MLFLSAAAVTVGVMAMVTMAPAAAVTATVGTVITAATAIVNGLFNFGQALRPILG